MSQAASWLSDRENNIESAMSKKVKLKKRDFVYVRQGSCLGGIELSQSYNYVIWIRHQVLPRWQLHSQQISIVYIN